MSTTNNEFTEKETLMSFFYGEPHLVEKNYNEFIKRMKNSLRDGLAGCFEINSKQMNPIIHGNTLKVVIMVEYTINWRKTY